jgi:DNA-binding transcriptional regulator YiaG
MSSAGSDHQDWEPVRLRSTGGAARDRVHYVHNEEGARLHKLETAEVVRIKKLTSVSVTALQGWRRENDLSQKQLNQRCSFPVNTINKLEARQSGPTDHQLRILQATTKLSLSLD